MSGIDLLTPFTYDYMQKAIWVSGLIGGVCAFLSCFITLKGWRQSCFSAHIKP